MCFSLRSPWELRSIFIKWGFGDKRSLKKTPLTPDLSLLETQRNVGMLAVRQLLTDLKRLTGGLDKRVNFQLGLETTQPFINCVLLFTWHDPSAFTGAALDWSQKRKATQCFITCCNWTNDRCSIHAQLQQLHHSMPKPSFEVCVWATYRYADIWPGKTNVLPDGVWCLVLNVISNKQVYCSK